MRSVFILLSFFMVAPKYFTDDYRINSSSRMLFSVTILYMRRQRARDAFPMRHLLTYTKIQIYIRIFVCWRISCV